MTGVDTSSRTLDMYYIGDCGPALVQFLPFRPTLRYIVRAYSIRTRPYEYSPSCVKAALLRLAGARSPRC